MGILSACLWVLQAAALPVLAQAVVQKRLEAATCLQAALAAAVAHLAFGQEKQVAQMAATEEQAVAGVALELKAAAWVGPVASAPRAGLAAQVSTGRNTGQAGSMIRASGQIAVKLAVSAAGVGMGSAVVAPLAVLEGAAALWQAAAPLPLLFAHQPSQLILASQVFPPLTSLGHGTFVCMIGVLGLPFIRQSTCQPSAYKFYCHSAACLPLAAAVATAQGQPKRRS
jgi:hypothetical protein